MEEVDKPLELGARPVFGIEETVGWDGLDAADEEVGMVVGLCEDAFEPGPLLFRHDAVLSSVAVVAKVGEDQAKFSLDLFLFHHHLIVHIHTLLRVLSSLPSLRANLIHVL